MFHITGDLLTTYRIRSGLGKGKPHGTSGAGFAADGGLLLDVAFFGRLIERRAQFAVRLLNALRILQFKILGQLAAVRFDQGLGGIVPQTLIPVLIDFLLRTARVCHFSNSSHVPIILSDRALTH